jgi:PTH1 family peptidyl-tRNA hydrolase
MPSTYDANVTDFLISGQGNPGKEHAGNRHNLGFWCIDVLARRHNIAMRGPKLWQRNIADAGKGRIAETEVVLVKPQTFYNGTGRAIERLLKRENVMVENLIVIYDDLDLPEGRIRIRPQGSHGGNNGLKSIINSLRSSDFGRVRVGVGRPWANGMPSWDQEHVTEWLLKDPAPPGREALMAAAERACDAIETVIANGWERAMDIYNRAEQS